MSQRLPWCASSFLLLGAFRFSAATASHQPNSKGMLEAQLSSLDGLSEAIAAEYTEEGGIFTLSVNPVNGYAMENVAGLKTALGTERTNAKAANDKLKAFGDLDVTAAQEALSKVAEMENWTPEEKVKQQILQRETQLTAKHGTEMATLQEEADGLRSNLEKSLIKGAAIAAITEHGGSVELLMPHIKGQTKLELVNGEYVAQVIGEDGAARVSMKPGSTDPMGIGELVESMRGMETYAPAFAGSGASGSGAAGSSAAGSGGKHTISFEEGHNPATYRERKAAADKAGVELVIQPYAGQQ